MREIDRPQVIGKALLAEIVWVVPSLLVLFVTLSSMMKFGSKETETIDSLRALVVNGVTSVCYGLIGLGLVRWVRNPCNEELGMWERERRRSP